MKVRLRKRSLSRKHAKHLAASGISCEVAGANRVYTVSDPEEVTRILNWKGPAAAIIPGIAFEYRDCLGNSIGVKSYRPDKPREDGKGKPIKYERPVGGSNYPYFPVNTCRHLLDTSRLLLITEGEKKAIAADAHGFACIGLAGVSGWSKPRRYKGQPRVLRDELRLGVEWMAREVFIVFDSDAVTNDRVCREEDALQRALRHLNAKVRVVRLSPGPDRSKVGLDDFLVQFGADAFKQLLVEATDPHVIVARTSADLANANLEVQYLIEGVLVQNQPCIMAGAKKTLKTSIGIDLAISLSTGEPFLGRFPVSQTARTLIMSGESGLATLRETGLRIASSKGLRLDEIKNLLWADVLPRFSDPSGYDRLEATLSAYGAEVAILDPAYLCLLGADAGNLFVQGEMLRTINEVCQAAGATLVLLHHTRKGNGGHKPPVTSQ